MNYQAWWLPELQGKLSQGDIISLLPIGILTSPPKFLKKGPTLGNNQQSWTEHLDYSEEKDGKTHFLTNGKMVHAIILSHDCELDKTSRVLVAPVVSLENLQEADRKKVLNQQTIHHMGLPDVPSLGDYYVDFRLTASVPKHVINNLGRLASMSPDAVRRLQANIIYFYTRLNPSV